MDRAEAVGCAGDAALAVCLLEKVLALCPCPPARAQRRLWYFLEELWRRRATEAVDEDSLVLRRDPETTGGRRA